jgi:hypothetical protein
MQWHRQPMHPGPAPGYAWIPWAVLLAAVASIAYVMNEAFVASGTDFTGLEASRSAECRKAWPSHLDVALGDACSVKQAGLEFSTNAAGATDVACDGGARPDALREADEVELRWLLNRCSHQPPKLSVGNGAPP